MILKETLTFLSLSNLVLQYAGLAQSSNSTPHSCQMSWRCMTNLNKVRRDVTLVNDIDRVPHNSPQPVRLTPLKHHVLDLGEAVRRYRLSCLGWHPSVFLHLQMLCGGRLGCLSFSHHQKCTGWPDVGVWGLPVCWVWNFGLCTPAMGQTSRLLTSRQGRATPDIVGPASLWLEFHQWLS